MVFNSCTNTTWIFVFLFHLEIKESFSANFSIFIFFAKVSSPSSDDEIVCSQQNV